METLGDFLTRKNSEKCHKNEHMLSQKVLCELRDRFIGFICVSQSKAIEKFPNSVQPFCTVSKLQSPLDCVKITFFLILSRKFLQPFTYCHIQQSKMLNLKNSRKHHIMRDFFLVNLSCFG